MHQTYRSPENEPEGALEGGEGVGVGVVVGGGGVAAGAVVVVVPGVGVGAGTGAGAGTGPTTPDASDTAATAPFLLKAVTATRSVEPTSVASGAYVEFTPPSIVEHPSPDASQRCHW
jgi:hypothetical protein